MELGILFFQVFTRSVPFIEDLQGLGRCPNWNWKKMERNFRRNGVGFSSGSTTRFCSFHRRSSQLCPIIGTNSNAISDEIALDLGQSSRILTLSQLEPEYIERNFRIALDFRPVLGLVSVPFIADYPDFPKNRNDFQCNFRRNGVGICPSSRVR